MRASQRVRQKASPAGGPGRRRKTLELFRVWLEPDCVKNIGERTPSCLQAATGADVEDLYRSVPEQSFEH